jgi:hypothetical protein
VRLRVRGLGGVVVVVGVRVRFRVSLGAPGAPCFWLWRAVLPAHGSDGAGVARSLTTPSPLRCDAVVNDLTWVGGQAEQRELLWAGCWWWCSGVVLKMRKQKKKDLGCDVVVAVGCWLSRRVRPAAAH